MVIAILTSINCFTQERVEGYSKYFIYNKNKRAKGQIFFSHDKDSVCNNNIKFYNFTNKSTSIKITVYAEDDLLYSMWSWVNANSSVYIDDAFYDCSPEKRVLKAYIRGL